MVIKSTDEVREAFLSFFESKGHKRIASDSLIPAKDPTLLFTGSGMNQFKDEFLGKVKDYRRATTSQKCLRTADLEKVGKTAGHHTFFEMLGNFSFGDYFKKEAIQWAWEFMTDILKVPEKELWISVYEEDDEAYKIWKEKIKVPEERIQRFGADENFWPADAPKLGPNGPCGPCTEIFYDQGEEYGCGKPTCNLNCECGRFVEVWNLVFTQFDREGVDKLLPLPNKNIDTGMGLERMARVLQKVTTNFEIDIFKPVVEAVAGELSVEYGREEKVNFCVNAIADHIRAVAFAISDGVVPSNEERGYVIRKLVRKATWYGKTLGKAEPFLYRIVPIVARVMKAPYPELTQRREDISQVVLAEEKRFQDTLQEGEKILSETVKRLKSEGKSILPGEFVFKLYDTYGFPADLAKEIAEESGFTLDMKGFELEMEGQRKKARAASTIAGTIFARETTLPKTFKTKFVGYDKDECEASVSGVVKDGKLVDAVKAGESAFVILDKTPFYAEAGGQVGDAGGLKGKGLDAEVTNTMLIGDTIVHAVTISKGELSKGEKLKATIDVSRRAAIRRNHTATHLLHNVLRTVLGPHVRQSGSLVAPDRLRFDFTHFEAVSQRDLDRIEALVNEKIMRNDRVIAEVMDFDQAKDEGAIALFGEKYGKKVRTLSVGDYSKELCGGTHVSSTGEIGIFRIVSEGSIKGGVRRIEAVTGEAALQVAKKDKEMVSTLSELLKAPPDKLAEQVEKLSRETKELKKRLVRGKFESAKESVDLMVSRAKRVGDVAIVAEALENIDIETLRSIADLIRERVKSGVFVLGSSFEEKAFFVTGVTQDLVGKGVHAGKIVDQVARIAGGSGGGKPNMAQAGAKDASKLKQAIEKAVEIVKGQLK